MTYKTHKQYAIQFAFIVSMILYIRGLSEVNYYLATLIIILVAKVGGLYPDIDHSWANVRDKTVPKFILNKLIHITGGKHRSWQTHSIDIVVIATIASVVIPNLLLQNNVISIVDKEILELLSIGFCSGWLSHILADMMTSAGVRLFCWNKKIIVKLVPKQIGKLKFNTGNEWEDFVFKIVKGFNIGLGFICTGFPFIVYFVSGIQK